MDEKKRKWEKPVLVDVGGVITSGACLGNGSTFHWDNCWNGPTPETGCVGGNMATGFLNCVIGNRVVYCYAVGTGVV